MPSVLIVDDEEQIVEMLQEMLEHLGYRLTVTPHSEEALNLFHFDPDAFFLRTTLLFLTLLRGFLETGVTVLDS